MLHKSQILLSELDIKVIFKHSHIQLFAISCRFRKTHEGGICSLAATCFLANNIIQQLKVKVKALVIGTFNSKQGVGGCDKSGVR